jgi:hydrogenase maturation factor HypF (carbamoyltransferase family)
MSDIATYTIYVTPPQIFEATKVFHHHNHFLSARFEAEHKVKVLDLTKFKYYQTKNNMTGELALEVEIDAKFTQPLKGEIWKPFET